MVTTEERRYRPLYIVILLPAIAGLLAYVAPEPSAALGRMILCILGILLVVSAVGAIFRLHRFNTWRVVYGIVLFSLFSLSSIPIFWRTWGQSDALLVFLLALFAAAGLFGFRHRRLILKEGIKPKTKLGKLIYALGMAFMLLGGVSGIALGKFLGAVLGANTGMLVLSVIILLLDLGIFTWTQCLWLKIEEPDWKP